MDKDYSNMTEECHPVPHKRLHASSKMRQNSKMTCLHWLWIVVFVLILVDIFLNRYLTCDNKVSTDMVLKDYVPPVHCTTDVPCEYPEIVTFRIIVITYNRAGSMLKLLKSLDKIEMDGDTARLEIWLDRSKKQTLSASTFQAAKDFIWTKGEKRVHVQEKHAGIYGQWIDTWKPTGNELAVILEDDISVSPFIWRWIKAAHKKYGKRDDILGYTLQSEGVNFAKGGGPIKVSKNQTSFQYRVIGSWGFAPHPKVWEEFQVWFHQIRQDKSFKPYIGGGVVFDSWYKSFEKKGTQDGMWTIWFINYTNRRNLYCVYNNINAYAGAYHKLAVHRAEPGLHFSGKSGKQNEHELLSTWKDDYIKFPAKTARFEFDGEVKYVD